MAVRVANVRTNLAGECHRWREKLHAFGYTVPHTTYITSVISSAPSFAAEPTYSRT